MALNFGQGGLFTVEEDGTFARKNIQINRSDTEPVLQNIGDMILWERGEGFIYDDYDSSIDAAKWTETEAGDGTVVETNTEIYGIVSGGPTITGTADFKAINLPALADLNEINFRAKLETGAGSTGTCRIYFGNQQLIVKSAGAGDDSIWKLTKNPDSTWGVWDDGALIDTITPANNELNFTAGATLTTYTGNAAKNTVYEITAEGGTYLMIKSTQRTFKINLASF